MLRCFVFQKLCTDDVLSVWTYLLQLIFVIFLVLLHNNWHLLLLILCIAVVPKDPDPVPL